MKYPAYGIIVLALLAVFCSKQEKQEIPAHATGAIQPSEQFPAWAAPAPVKPDQKKPWEAMGDPAVSAAAMKQSIRRTRYLVETDPVSPVRPFMMLRMGTLLTDLGEDRVALHTLIQTRLLPADTPHDRHMHGFPTLASVQRRAAIDQARVLARNGVKTAPAVFDSVGPLTGYDLLRKAEVYMLLGEKEKAFALLAAPRLDGHPDRIFSMYLITLRAAGLARAMGMNPLVKDLAESMLKEPQEKSPHPQWQASWQILQDITATAAAGKNWWESPLSDGVYTGSSRGYAGQVTVQVTVRDGRIDTVTAAGAGEDRPYSSLEIIPQRIAQKQSLTVDAVTGATITSCAILAAVDKALSGAP